ncbi:MAG: molybdopterin-guanine dinucleotide biosynthesis protein B [Pseudomonadota bacterium]
MIVYGVVGWKNSGKTGLMERLVAHFVAAGLTVSTIKHAHHRVDVDTPGTDSFRHRGAGAKEVLLTSQNRWALMHELSGEAELSLEEAVARLSPVDLVLVEGFKAGAHPKIEAHRQATGKAPLAAESASVRAVAADGPLNVPCPVLDLDDTAAIADFIRRDTGL